MKRRRDERSKRYLLTKRSNDWESSLWFTRSLTLEERGKEKKKPASSFDIDVLVSFEGWHPSFFKP